MVSNSCAVKPPARPLECWLSPNEHLEALAEIETSARIGFAMEQLKLSGKQVAKIDLGVLLNLSSVVAAKSSLPSMADIDLRDGKVAEALISGALPVDVIVSVYYFGDGVKVGEIIEGDPYSKRFGGIEGLMVARVSLESLLKLADLPEVKSIKGEQPYIKPNEERAARFVDDLIQYDAFVGPSVKDGYMTRYELIIAQWIVWFCTDNEALGDCSHAWESYLPLAFEYAARQFKIDPKMAEKIYKRSVDIRSRNISQLTDDVEAR